VLLFLGGIALHVVTARRTVWLAGGLVGGGAFVALAPWLGIIGDDPERRAKRHRRRVVFWVAGFVTVAAFLAVKLLR
jgi:predicted cobalt transporter CbtA